MNISLPLPPTKNQLHKIARGRMYLSKQLLDWREEAGYMLLSQWKAPRKAIKGKVYVSLYYILHKRRDIDSGEAILDFLQQSGVIENDDQVYHLVAQKEIDKEEKAQVIIEIERIV